MNIFPNIYETRWIDLKPESPLDRPEEIVKLRIPIAIGIAKHMYSIVELVFWEMRFQIPRNLTKNPPIWLAALDFLNSKL